MSTGSLQAVTLHHSASGCTTYGITHGGQFRYVSTLQWSAFLDLAFEYTLQWSAFLDLQWDATMEIGC